MFDQLKNFGEQVGNPNFDLAGLLKNIQVNSSPEGLQAVLNKLGLDNIDVKNFDLDKIDFGSLDLQNFKIGNLDLNNIDLSNLDLGNLNPSELVSKLFGGDDTPNTPAQ